MKKIFTLCALCFLSLSAVSQMRITEFMYDGGNAEFVEFTNVGNATIDMTGWSFDDNSRVAGSETLSAFGIVQPGESVVFAEAAAGTFRTAWGLCAGVKIIGGNINNLGRSDEINLYDASNTLVDRLTFNDQGTGTVKAPRTQNKSAWVPLTALGVNNASLWTLSAAADSEASFTSTGGDIGSPGKSTRATVAFNPCTPVTNAPAILINTTVTSNFLDGGAITSPASPYSISGVISDPTDPASILGVDFTISDPDTPAGSLTVTAVSSNAAVVSSGNLNLTGSGTTRNIKITPAAVGYSNITLTVSDGVNTASYILHYGASAAATTPASTLWHTGISDGSAAIALDDNYYLIADDELDVLNVYSRTASGLALKSYDYSAGLSLPDPAKPEVDVEAAAKSPVSTSKIYWLGSMSNGKGPSFDDKPNRNRIFATTVAGTGSATAFTFSGYYGSLRAALISWGDANSYNFTASAAAGIDSKAINGLAAEGMVFGPDNTTLYIGLRAPLVPTANRTKAVIAPILNFEAWFNNGSPAGSPAFGNPIELNLGNRGIRDITRLSNGTYIIIAGNYAGSPIDGAIYKWTGNATDAPVLVSSPASNLLAMEGVMQVNVSGQLSASKLQVITDGGDEVLYNDGSAAKDLGDLNLRKFRSDNLTALDLCQLTATVSASGSTTLCAGSSVTLTANASMSGYLWSNGATTRTISVSTAGNYTVSITDSNGCTGTSTAITVNVKTLPSVSITPDGSTDFCAGTTRKLTATGGATSYSWSTGINTASINVTTTGNYIVTITGSNNCSASASLFVQSHNNVSNPGIIGPDQTHCGPFQPAQFTSVANAVADPGEIISYQWLKSNVDVINTYGNPYWQAIPGATVAAYQADSVFQSAFYVRCSRTQYCSFLGTTTESEIVDIYVNTPPTATITTGGNTNFCSGGFVTLGANAGMAGYLWSNSATTQTINASASGNYFVTVTDSNGCSASSAPLTISVTPATSSNNTVIACSNYFWNGTTYTASGVYSYTTQNAAGCDSIANLNITINHVVNSSATITACNNYVWNGTTYTTSGAYTYTTQNAAGCDSIAQLNLTLLRGPLAGISPGGSPSFCPGGFVTLTAQVFTGTISSYLWSNGATTPTINVSAQESFTVQVTDVNGCSITTFPVTVINALPQDFNSDGKANVDDFLIFAPKFNTTCTCQEDLDKDGDVDIDDFLLFAPAFNTSCR